MTEQDRHEPVGVVPLAETGEKTASHAATSSTQLKSWAQYVDLLKPAADLIDLTWEPKSPEQRADLYRQFVINISQGYFVPRSRWRIPVCRTGRTALDFSTACSSGAGVGPIRTRSPRCASICRRTRRS
jgi:hypothetical protein